MEKPHIQSTQKSSVILSNKSRRTTGMQMQEIKLEEIEPTIRKIFAAGGDFTFYPKGTSMHPFVEQGRDKITLAPIQDQVRKYDVILYKRKNGAFVLHRVVGERADGYIFRGDNQFVKEYGIKKEQMIGRMTEIIRSDEVIRVDDVKHRLWAMLWVHTALLRRIRNHCHDIRRQRRRQL